MAVAPNLQAALDKHRAGRLDEAIPLYEQIVQADPQHADAWHLLGVAAHQQQRHERAVELILRALAIRPSAAFQSNLGAAYRALGRCQKAAACFREAIDLAPNFAGAHYNLGNALKDLGEHAAAVESYRRALSIEPGSADTWNNLADALKSSRHIDQAIAASQRAIELQPEFAEAHFNLGNSLRAVDRWDEAARCYSQAIAIRPNYVDAHVNRGFTLEDLGRIDEAIAAYEEALAHDPRSAEAHFNRALAWLRTGDFDRGWTEYEWRWQRKEHSPAHADIPGWDGSPPGGRTILIHAEQGIGDEIMFSSCVCDLLEQGVRPIVECDSRLVPLFARSFSGATVIPTGGSVDADVRIACGSLPRLVRPTLVSFPQRSRYLVADPATVSAWKVRLGRLGDGLKIGISWRGGKEADVERKRSTRLSQWAELLQTPGTEFVNLQYGDSRDELSGIEKDTDVAIHDFPEVDPLRNLDHFAALVSALDLVVSVDNSTVHLAGALGVPTWVLLPFASDWRWLMDRDDSPWYGTVRLFRQPTSGDWDAVFAEVTARFSKGSADVFTASASRKAAG